MSTSQPVKARRRKKNTASGSVNPSAGEALSSDSLYSRHFSTVEREQIESLQACDLSAEISMLRVAILHVFAAVGAGGNGSSEADEAGKPNSSSDWMEVLDTLGMAASRLANLLRTQHMLNASRTDDVSAALSRALTEITKEMKLE